MTCRTCWWRVDGDRCLSYWLNFVAAILKIERRLDCINVRPKFSQWERRWSPSSTWNYVSTRKQQNTLQLTTFKKIAVFDWRRFTLFHMGEGTIDNTAKGGMTLFWELFTVIPCAPKDFKRYWHWYLKTVGSQIKNEGSLKLKKVPHVSWLKIIKRQ